jgi:hypothetical protein
MAVILLVIAVAAIARFVALEHSPPGFATDEAAGATHVLCLAETGRDAWGVPHPLFARALGRGFATAPFLYFGVVWTRLCGSSIAALRGMAAFFSALTLVAVALIARRLAGPRAMPFAALAAALSPPLFQFARIAWDPALVPALLGFGVYFLLGQRRYEALLGGVFLALAAYAYPPARVQVPLVMMALLAFRRGTPGQPLLGAAALALTSIPLVARSLSGELQERFSAISIMAPHAHNPHGSAGPLRLAWLFLQNIGRHLRPDYLLFHGDINVRHSTRLVGELSWVDMLALGGGALLLARALGRRRLRWSAQAEDAPLAFAASCALAGVVPSALTYEGVPHALRSIGEWPFVALLSGIVLLRLAAAHIVWSALTAVTALAFAGFFGVRYFVDYPPTATVAFDAPDAEAAVRLRGDPVALTRVLGGTPELAARYYLMAYGGDGCVESASRLVGQ